jgi:hypothetical protein
MEGSGKQPDASEPADPLDEPAESSSARNFVADAVRKAVLTGLGAVFLTEEGARKLARDWKLPKEIVGYVVAQAGSAKDEVLRVVNDEIRKFFQSEALRREFLRLISSMSIEVQAEIRLKPARGGQVHPKVEVSSVRPRVRRGSREENDADGEREE